MWDLRPSFVDDPSPASGDPRRQGSSLRSISSERYFREKQFTIDVETGKYGEHRAQEQCTNVTPHSAKFVISTRSPSHDIVRSFFSPFFNNSESDCRLYALPVVIEENKIYLLHAVPPSVGQSTKGLLFRRIALCHIFATII